MNRAIDILIWTVVAFSLVEACAPTSKKPSAYLTALAACNVASTTCEQSIECENRVRAAAGRPLRVQDGCK